jgi:CheY-like chemotaxis protein/HPt (histidine-containing phosphotransfer) domain-containing protein
VHSVVGKGSVFWFNLPLVQSLAEKGNALASQALPEMHMPIVLDDEPKASLETDGKIRLLIVDDEETNRIVMKETFRNSGVEVLTANNGQEAVDACRRARFNLILMDCQMPVVDGFAATRTILEESAGDTQGPAIIALTADATPATKKRCQEMGMVDYLIKPIDFNKLQAILSDWLPELRTSIVPGTEANTHDAAPKGQNVGSAVINTAVLERLREHVGNITPVAGVFLRSLERRLVELEQAIERNDADAINKVAHTMKGSSSQFGAEELTHFCLLAENMGKSGNIQQIARIFTQIVAAVGKVKLFFAEQLD